MSVMTTKDNFPVVDITHKPRRTQGGNLKAVAKDSPSPTESNTSPDVPNVVTLERAILFYESHAEGEFQTLYAQTARWLREYMSRTVPVPSGEDTDKAKELFEKVRGG